MVDHSLVQPFLAQILLTIIVLLWLAFTRVTALSNKDGMAAVQANGFPPRAEKASNNYKNQFELPVLFLALCLFAMVAGIDSDYLTTLAWVYIAARVFHSVIQLGPNVIFPWRFGSFVLSAICVVQMLITISIRAL